MKSTKRNIIHFCVDLFTSLLYFSLVVLGFFGMYQMPISSIFSFKEWFFLFGGCFCAGLFTYRFFSDTWKSFKDLLESSNS